MRTNPSVVVVPPFECAWLTEPEFVLEGSRGCITFEVKGTMLWGDDGVAWRGPSDTGARRAQAGVEAAKPWQQPGPQPSRAAPHSLDLDVTGPDPRAIT